MTFIDKKNTKKLFIRYRYTFRWSTDFSWAYVTSLVNTLLLKLLLGSMEVDGNLDSLT